MHYIGKCVGVAQEVKYTTLCTSKMNAGTEQCHSSGVGSTGAPGAGAPMKFSWVHTGLYSGILEGSGSKAVASPSHRLQLSLNLRDSPGFLAIVPGPGRLYYNCISGP
jgi:hypothetical protein